MSDYDEDRNGLNLDWAGEYTDSQEHCWADSQRIWPSKLNAKIGKVYFHSGKGHLYEIIGISYQAEDDRWMLAYRQVTKGGLKTGPVFCHRPEDFEREGRFMEVMK